MQPSSRLDSFLLKWWFERTQWFFEDFLRPGPFSLLFFHPTSPLTFILFCGLAWIYVGWHRLACNGWWLIEADESHSNRYGRLFLGLSSLSLLNWMKNFRFPFSLNSFGANSKLTCRRLTKIDKLWRETPPHGLVKKGGGRVYIYIYFFVSFSPLFY